MLVEDFRRRFEFMQRMTIDFVAAVPDGESTVTKRAEFAKKHSHYTGGLGREEPSIALVDSYRDLLGKFEAADERASIDFFGTPFSLGGLGYTIVQHEAIHHGQWSIYAGLAGFETPLSWRNEWGL